MAYAVLPGAWDLGTRRHRAVETAPRLTRTRNGISGDPINLALVGTQDEVAAAFLIAGWRPADPITLRTSLRITETTLLRRPYDQAPVSGLYLWGRCQDLAFQEPVGRSPKQRHHVRFWRSGDIDEVGRRLWLGAATYDSRIELSRTTGQLTHHIDADVDRERDKILADLGRTGFLAGVEWQDAFQTKRHGRNGGGDAYFTDGRLAIGTLARLDGTPGGRMVLAPP
jgi:hypothetical protein